jgi:hypothetical protein
LLQDDPVDQLADRTKPPRRAILVGSIRGESVVLALDQLPAVVAQQQRQQSDLALAQPAAHELVTGGARRVGVAAD